jgi:tetratricopeptide (TPR) repeat protein
MLCRMGEAKQAEPVVRHGIQTDADIADGHIVLGLVLLQLRRLDEAEKSVREALALQQPSSIKARLVLADIEGARGNYAGQAENLDAYLKANPKDRAKKIIQIARDMARKLASQTYAKLARSAK